MKKRFVFKKNKSRLIRRIITIFLITISFIISKNKLSNYYIDLNNKDNLNYLLNNSFNHKNDNKYILKKVLNIFNKDLYKPTTLLTYNNNYKTNEIIDNYSDEDIYNPTDYEKITSYIENTNKIIIDDPLVYIYNTHQLETYSNEGLENYNMSPNVMMASYLLSEKLNNLGIKTIAEDTNIYDFINKVGLEQDALYKASRLFIKQAKEKYPNLKLIIDLHRDSVDKSISEIEINGNNYARLLFVLGTTNDNYKENEVIMSELSDRLNTKYNKLSRGIYYRPTPTWPDSYNQDLGKEIILIELGGKDNNINEVINTIDALSEIISEYIKDTYEK